MPRDCALSSFGAGFFTSHNIIRFFAYAGRYFPAGLLNQRLGFCAAQAGQGSSKHKCFTYYFSRRHLPLATGASSSRRSRFDTQFLKRSKQRTISINLKPIGNTLSDDRPNALDSNQAPLPMLQITLQRFHSGPQ